MKRRRRDIRGCLFKAALLSSLVVAFVTLGTAAHRRCRRWSRVLDARFLTGPPSIDPQQAGARPAIRATLYLGVLLLVFSVANRRRDGDLPRGVRGQASLVQPTARGQHPESRSRSLDRLRDPRPRVHRARAVRHRPRAARGCADPDPARAPDGDHRRREAIRSVPASIREGAFALGATRWQVVWRQVLPAAIPGIATGSILALSRGIGETAPLLLIGALTYIAFDPTLLGPFTALPVQIFNWVTAAAGGVPQARGLGHYRSARNAADPERVRDLAAKPLPALMVSATPVHIEALRPSGHAPGSRGSRLRHPQPNRARTTAEPGDQGRDLRGLSQLRDGDHRPSGLRQEHVHPLPEPDERPHPGRFGRRHDPLPRRGPLRTRHRSGRGAAADRHGLPEAESVSEVDLRQRRLRTARARDERRTSMLASSARCSRRRSGTR